MSELWLSIKGMVYQIPLFKQDKGIGILPDSCCGNNTMIQKLVSNPAKHHECSIWQYNYQTCQYLIFGPRYKNNSNFWKCSHFASFDCPRIVSCTFLCSSSDHFISYISLFSPVFVSLHILLPLFLISLFHCCWQRTDALQVTLQFQSCSYCACVFN